MNKTFKEYLIDRFGAETFAAKGQRGCLQMMSNEEIDEMLDYYADAVVQAKVYLAAFKK